MLLIEKLRQLEQKIDTSTPLDEDDMILVRYLMKEIIDKLKFHQTLSIIEQKLLEEVKNER
jgi:hypothetical protein